MLPLAARVLLRQPRLTAGTTAAGAALARRLLATGPPAPPNNDRSKGQPRPSAPSQTPSQQPTSERTPPSPPPPPSASGPFKSTPPPLSPQASAQAASDAAAAPTPGPLPSLDITSSSSLPAPPPPEGSQSPPSGSRTGAKAASTQTSIDRQRRYLARLWTGLFLAGLGGAAVYLGRDWTEAEVEAGLDQGVEKGFLARFKKRTGEASDYFNKPQWKELLPPPLPFPHGRPYTLVIDIDDLLVASTWDRQHGWRTAKRPGVDYFLAYMSQFYEIVVFTTQYVYSAQPILESLDPFQAYIQYRLFRESARTHNGQLVKDLSYLNRDLSKVIMLDTVKEHAALQPDNAIVLKKWDGTPGDKGLVGLIPFLESIAIHKVPDVRPILHKYADKDIPTAYALVEAEQKRLAIEEWNARHPPGHTPGLGGFTLSSIFGAPGAPQQPKMPMSYLEQKRAEAQQVYREEQEYFEKNREEMKRIIEEDRQRQLGEMRGSLFGYLGLQGKPAADPRGTPEEQREGPGPMGAPVAGEGKGGTTGGTPPVVGPAAGAAGKSA